MRRARGVPRGKRNVTVGNALRFIQVNVAKELH